MNNEDYITNLKKSQELLEKLIKKFSTSRTIQSEGSERPQDQPFTVSIGIEEYREKEDNDIL